MSTSQTRGVVLLEAQAYQRLLDAASNREQPQAKVETRDAETQTTPIPANDDQETYSHPMEVNVSETSCQRDHVHEALEEIPKSFRPACFKIIQLLPNIESLTGNINWPGTPLHGLPLKTLLMSTCVPFKPRPADNIIKFLREQGVAKFRNHRLNEESCKAVRYFPSSWESPYTF